MVEINKPLRSAMTKINSKEDLPSLHLLLVEYVSAGLFHELTVNRCRCLIKTDITSLLWWGLLCGCVDRVSLEEVVTKHSMLTPTRASKLIALVINRNYDTNGLSLWERCDADLPVENCAPGMLAFVVWLLNYNQLCIFY